MQQFITKAAQTIQDSFQVRRGPANQDEPGRSGLYRMHSVANPCRPEVNLEENSGKVKMRERDNPNIPHRTPAKFVKVDAQTNPSTIVNFMKRTWKIRKPRLLISVTGGAGNFPLNGPLRDAFRRGLIKASLSTNAWIISGGTYAGVMKYVGEAVRDFGVDAAMNVVAIGIATWGIIDHRHELLSHLQKPCSPEELDGEDSKPSTCDPFEYEVKSSRSLDPNHTHFILVDSGKEEFGGEVDLRGRVIEYLVKRRGVKFHVCVLLEGGPNSLKTVQSALDSNTPVVVIRGTGRIADVLASAYDALINGSDWKDLARNNIRQSEGMQRDMNVEGFITIMEKCLERKEALTFCKLDDSTDLPGVILNALLRAANVNRRDQLKIAMIWNRAEVAREKLFSHGKQWDTEELRPFFHEAICNNQVEFIQLFLDQDLSVQKYLTQYELTSLYNDLDPKSFLYHLLRKHRPNSRTTFTLSDVSKLIKTHTFSDYKLIHQQYNRNRYRPDFLTAPKPTEEEVAEGGRYTSPSMMRRSNSDAKMAGFSFPYQELFLYAILQDRFELATLFWERCKEPIAAALTATNILKNIAFSNDRYFPDECADMKKSAEKFEQMAVRVLDECQDENAATTAEVLTVTRPNWGKASCVKIGFSVENLKFTSHTSVQNVLNRMWLGEISATASSFVIWSALFFPPAIFFVQFRHDDREEQHYQETESDDDTESQEGESGAQPQQNPRESKLLQRRSLLKQNSTDWDAGDICATNPEENEPLESVSEEESDTTIRNPRRKLGYCARVFHFFTSPVVKFNMHLISYFAFLGLFSYIMLCDFHETISIPEIVLVVWVGTLFFEELRQVVQADNFTFQGKVQIWFGDFWNRIDTLNLVLFSLGFTLRFFPNLNAARIVLCCDLMFFFVRMLNSFLVVKSLGPKLLMIGKMMVDLLLFCSILSVFLLSYGIASQAILYPNTSGFLEVIRGITYRAYFQVFGELFLEVIEGDTDCSNNATLIAQGEMPCPQNSWMAVILLGVYMLVSNVLLLNLLIAMFSYTFTTVQENTDEVWKFHRYELIKEYIDKPFLVPPFIIIAHVVRLIRCLCCKPCIGGPKQGSDRTEGSETAMTEQSLMHWEYLRLETYMAKQRTETVKDIGKQVQNLGKKVDRIESSMSRTQLIEKKLESVEQRVQDMESNLEKQLADIIDLIKKSQQPDTT